MKIEIRLPNVVRALCGEIESLLGTSYGVPMNFEYTTNRSVSLSEKDGLHAHARIFWAGGMEAKIVLTSGRHDGYGEWHNPTEIGLSVRFQDFVTARAWLMSLTDITGMLDVTFRPTSHGAMSARLTLNNDHLTLLRQAASNRRNSMAA